MKRGLKPSGRADESARGESRRKEENARRESCGRPCWSRPLHRWTGPTARRRGQVHWPRSGPSEKPPGPTATRSISPAKRDVSVSIASQIGALRNCRGTRGRRSSTNSWARRARSLRFDREARNKARNDFSRRLKCSLGGRGRSLLFSSGLSKRAIAAPRTFVLRLFGETLRKLDCANIVKRDLEFPVGRRDGDRPAGDLHLLSPSVGELKQHLDAACPAPLVRRVLHRFVGEDGLAASRLIRGVDPHRTNKRRGRDTQHNQRTNSKRAGGTGKIQSHATLPSHDGRNSHRCPKDDFTAIAKRDPAKTSPAVNWTQRRCGA